MDLRTFSKETLISIIHDLQNEVDKLKTHADIRITEIERLLESQIDIINKNTSQTDTSTQTEEYYREKEECYREKDFDINKYENVWYMNGNAEDLDKWYLKVKSGFVTTWNDNGKNHSVLDKLKTGDLIAWYIVSKGFNSILEVSGKPHEINDDELKLFYNTEEKKESMKKHNYTIISIPVKFLVTSKDKFVLNNKSLMTEICDSDWTYGLRGSHCIKPKSIKWCKQVEDIYNFLKDN